MAGDFTHADLDRLNEALRSGTKRVQQGSKMVEYQTIPDMIKLRDRMITELDATTAGPRVMTTRASFGGRR